MAQRHLRFSKYDYPALPETNAFELSLQAKLDGFHYMEDVLTKLKGRVDLGNRVRGKI